LTKKKRKNFFQSALGKSYSGLQYSQATKDVVEDYIHHDATLTKHR